MDWSVLKDRLIEAAAAAALLGGGAQLVSNTVGIAQQETRVERLEKLDERLDKIADDVTKTRETVVRLETKLEETP